MNEDGDTEKERERDVLSVDYGKYIYIFYSYKFFQHNIENNFKECNNYFGVYTTATNIYLSVVSMTMYTLLFNLLNYYFIFLYFMILQCVLS